MTKLNCQLCFVTLLLLPAAAFAQATPTFSKDVAPLLNQHCVSCHRPGDMAPMSLLSYERARPWAKAIKEKVATGVMPPWHSDAPRGVFANPDPSVVVRWGQQTWQEMQYTGSNYTVDGATPPPTPDKQ